MTGDAGGIGRILGSLRSADGEGVVRMEDRLDTSIDDLWSALTGPRRLARWMGEVEGDLRLGGEFRARFLPAAGKTPGGWKRASSRSRSGWGRGLDVGAVGLCRGGCLGRGSARAVRTFAPSPTA